MPKTNFPNRIKIAFLNMMQAIGSAASQLASNAKLRVQEINLESRRHEILTEFSLQAFEMWHNGVKLPKELSDMFVELSEIDDKLSVLRAQQYAKVKVACEVTGDDGQEPVPTVCEVEMPADTAQAPAEPEASAKEPEKKPAAKEPADQASAKKTAAEKPAAASTKQAETAAGSEPKKPRPTIRRKAKATPSKSTQK